MDFDHFIELTSLRGKDVKLENINFSFYFSRKWKNDKCNVKICWNRNMITSNFNILEICGNYLYRANNQIVDEKELDKVKNFFKKYKVLFAAVWEEKLDTNDLAFFLRSQISFDELLDCFYNMDKNLIKGCKSLKELEECVRKYHIFNMND